MSLLLRRRMLMIGALSAEDDSFVYAEHWAYARNYGWTAVSESRSFAALSSQIQYSSVAVGSDCCAYQANASKIIVNPSGSNCLQGSSPTMVVTGSYTWNRYKNLAEFSEPKTDTEGSIIQLYCPGGTSGTGTQGYIYKYTYQGQNFQQGNSWQASQLCTVNVPNININWSMSIFDRTFVTSKGNGFIAIAGRSYSNVVGGVKTLSGPSLAYTKDSGSTWSTVETAETSSMLNTLLDEIDISTDGKYFVGAGADCWLVSTNYLNTINIYRRTAAFCLSGSCAVSDTGKMFMGGTGSIWYSTGSGAPGTWVKSQMNGILSGSGIFVTHIACGKKGINVVASFVSSSNGAASGVPIEYYGGGIMYSNDGGLTFHLAPNQEAYQINRLRIPKI